VSADHTCTLLPPRRRALRVYTLKDSRRAVHPSTLPHGGERRPEAEVTMASADGARGGNVRCMTPYQGGARRGLTSSAGSWSVAFDGKEPNAGNPLSKYRAVIG